MFGKTKQTDDDLERRVHLLELAVLLLKDEVDKLSTEQRKPRPLVFGEPYNVEYKDDVCGCGGKCAEAEESCSG